MQKSKELKLDLPSDDELYTTQEERDEAMCEVIKNLPLSEISDFPNHPFKVKEDEKMMELIESVSEHGVLAPALVRPKDNGYEMISGHRRKYASNLVGKTEIPCIIRDLNDDEATILLVDSNLQREEILPSERAFAYKMKIEALNHQGKRNDLTSTPMVSKLRTNERVGQEHGDSREQVNENVILSILQEEKPNQVEKIKIPKERISKFFPKGTPEKKIEETIVKALELYQKRERQKQSAR